MKKKLLEKIIETQLLTIEAMRTDLELFANHSKETINVLCEIIDEQSETITDMRNGYTELGEMLAESMMDKEDIASMISPDLLRNAVDGEEVLRRLEQDDPVGDTDGDPKEVFDD